MRRLVGRNFARIRRENDPAREQMEEPSGCSRQYISGLEQGHRNPTVVTLYELAQALGGHRSICCGTSLRSVAPAGPSGTKSAC